MRKGVPALPTRLFGLCSVCASRSRRALEQTAEMIIVRRPTDRGYHERIMTDQKSQIGVVAGIFAAGLLLGWLFRGFVAQPHDAFTVATYGDWRLSCPPRALANMPCQISQELVAGKRRAFLLRVSLWRADDKPVLAMVAPYDVLLSSGLGLKVGNAQPKTIAYKACSAVGCVANVVGDSTLFDSIVDAPTLQVTITSLKGKPVALNVSTKGLSEAASAMRSAESMRHSWLRRTFL